MLGTRTILGLAIDEFGVIVAEVSARPGRPQIRHTGHLAFEEKLSSDSVKSLAQQLRQFLRTNHFSSKQVVIGIPMKWVVAREMVAPPASPDAIAGILGIAAERAFSLNASELIFDYCGQTSGSEDSRVMLLAARRQIVEQVRELAGGAGLHVQAVTVSALAFGAGRSRSGSEQHYGLYTRPSYCEFWSRLNGRLQSIQHVPIVGSNGSAGDRSELLTTTIQRQVMLISQQDQAAPYEVTLYDASGLAGAGIDRLNRQLKPQITVADGRSAYLPDASIAEENSEEAQSVAAVAVAVSGVGTDGPAVDFLNPRIGAKKLSSRKKAVTWAVCAGVVFVVAIAAVVVDWRLKSSEIAADEAKLAELKPRIEAAQQVVDRMTYAAAWTSQTPRFLECLKELTLVFPMRPTVWATNLGLNENGEGSLIGKAVDEASALEVIGQIKKNPAFSDIRVNYLRDAGKDTKDFSVNFKFKGGK
jgi:hypothetical protein